MTLWTSSKLALCCPIRLERIEPWKISVRLQKRPDFQSVRLIKCVSRFSFRLNFNYQNIKRHWIRSRAALERGSCEGKLKIFIRYGQLMLISPFLRFINSAIGYPSLARDPLWRHWARASGGVCSECVREFLIKNTKFRYP